MWYRHRNMDVRMMSRTTAACHGGLDPGTQLSGHARGEMFSDMATIFDTVCLTMKIGKTRERVLPLSQYAVSLRKIYFLLLFSLNLILIVLDT